MSSSTESCSVELHVDPAKLSRRRTGLYGDSLRTSLSTANSTALPQSLLLDLSQTNDTITHVQQESPQSPKHEPQISLFIPKHLGQQQPQQIQQIQQLDDSTTSENSSLSSSQQQQQSGAVNNNSNSSFSSIVSTANTHDHERHGHGIKNDYNNNNNNTNNNNNGYDNTDYILGATTPELQTSMKKSHTLQYLKRKYIDKISTIKNNENEDLYLENFIMKTNNDYAYYQQTLARNTRHSKTYNLVSQIQHIINLKNHKNKESNNVQNNIETRNRTDRLNNKHHKNDNSNNNSNCNNKRMYTSHSYVQLAKGSVNETGTRYLRTRSNIISRARSSINNKSTVGGMYASEHLGYDKCHCSNNNNNNNQSIKEADDSIILSLLGRPRGRHSAYTMDNNTKNKAFSKSARGINNNGLKKNKNRQNYNQSNYASTNVLLPTICQKNNGIKPNKPQMKKTFSMTKNEFRKFKNKNKKSTKIGNNNNNNNNNNQLNDDTSTISTHFNNGLFTYRHKNKNNNNGEDSVGLYGSDLKTIGMTNIELKNYGFDYRSLQLRNQHSNKTEINQINQNIILKLSMIHEQINQIQTQLTENKPNLNQDFSNVNSNTATTTDDQTNIEKLYLYSDSAQQHSDLLIKSNQFKLQLMLNQLKIDAM